MTTAHVDQDSLKLIQQGFEAFAAGDMAALTKLFDADAEWHEAPKGVIVGNYHGRDAISGFFGQVAPRNGRDTPRKRPLDGRDRRPGLRSV